MNFDGIEWEDLGNELVARVPDGETVPEIHLEVDDGYVTVTVKPREAPVIEGFVARKTSPPSGRSFGR